MATEVTKIIDPDMGASYDYDSLFDWEAAQQGDLTGARNEQATAQLRPTSGGDDSTLFTVAGWTVSATQFVKITSHPDYRHAGVWDDAKATHKNSVEGSDGIRLEVDYCVVEYLQTYVGSTDSNLWAATIAVSASYCTVRGNIISGTSGNVNRKTGIYIGDVANVGVLVYRNIVYNFNRYDASSRAICIFYNPNSGSATNVICQNTMFNADYGFYGVDLAFTLTQNYSGFNTICFYGTTGVTSSKNISSDATSPDGASYQSKTAYSDYFVDYANNDFHLKSTDTVLKDAGDSLAASFSVDIDGQTVTGTWDIGADEYFSIEQEGFRFRNDDGSESAATWKANQDTNITLAADTAFRLRCLLKATGNPDSINAQAEARVKPSGGAFGAWGKIN